MISDLVRIALTSLTFTVNLTIYNSHHEGSTLSHRLVSSRHYSRNPTSFLVAAYRRQLTLASGVSSGYNHSNCRSQFSVRNSSYPRLFIAVFKEPCWTSLRSNLFSPNSRRMVWSLGRSYSKPIIFLMWLEHSGPSTSIKSRPLRARRLYYRGAGVGTRFEDILNASNSS